MAGTLTPEIIQSIIDNENLVVRNLQVTQGYYRLSEGMRRWMSRKNVSWLAFATHASKTAGQALRHELMPRSVKSAMVRAAGYNNTYMYLNESLGKQEPTVEHNSLLAAAMKRVSLLVSKGNVLVFAELARPFSSLLETFKNDWVYDETKLDDFLHANLRPGPLEQDGQDYLFEAIASFYKARFETNSKRKAEYILQGNLLIGLHEQTRLQPYIDQALATPFDIILKGQAPGDPGALRDRLRSPGGGLSRDIVTRAVTRMWMSFSLPSRDLKLGQDVVAPTGVINFPSELLRIESPRCKELVMAFDKQMDTLSGSAAENWVRLKDRMTFVVDFFRSHQQYKRLFEQPFLDEQIAAIDAGHLPAGPL